jgi:hypothetical protein
METEVSTMRFLTVCLAAMLLIVSAGCDVGDPCRTSCDPDAGDGIIMFDDMDDITLHTDQATITVIGIVGNTLCLTVQYSGGCRDHEFELYGMNAFLESYPPQAPIYLSHDANGDACEALITTELEFDLTPLRNAYQRVYDDDGPVLLRILEPGATDPVKPLVLYEF